ncbi:ParA family protein [Psychromonas antarctica]|uniref:ParA family protein n=1 Tax=Psychromonas antarctica TaxID=67573 RepID=UPI001EE922D9|nr:ParA family protein [Psychromonas antarctica]MCG6202026.1 ParA family protein [Psychromonas antarctica]
MILSFLGQKGGGGKSTFTRATAVEYAKNGWSVHVADMDERQGSTFKWSVRRSEAKKSPEVEVAIYLNEKTALRAAATCDLLIVDGKPYSSKQTLKIAEASDLIVIPTGTTIDDLEPSLELARELVQAKIPLDRIIFIVNKVASIAEAKEAVDTIRTWGFITTDLYLDYKAGYGKSMDEGLGLTESRWASIAEKSDQIISWIGDQLMEKNNG